MAAEVYAISGVAAVDPDAIFEAPVENGLREVGTEGAARINDRGNLKVGRAESQKTSRR